MSGAVAALPAAPVLRCEVRPPWPFRLPRQSGMDGVLRVEGARVRRLLHVEGRPVLVAVAQPADDRVVFAARAERPDAAEEGIARMRFALGVDDDLRGFHERFRHDRLIGHSVRGRPWFRVRRRPEPFEALAWAITEQLIETARAADIQRRIVRRLGRHCPLSGLRDLPDAVTLAATAPAELCGLDLAAPRAITLTRAAREVASGRVDLRDEDHGHAWRRLRAIPGIGAWTIELTALHGQGRLDQVPAGDLNLLKLAGRVRTGSPHVLAEEAEVRALFALYAPWGGLAAMHAIASGAPRLR